MEPGAWLILWGSPVGIAIFFAGLGVLLWGVSRLKLSEVARKEFELEERQRFSQRTQAKGPGTPTA